METKISIIQFMFSYDWKVLSDSLGANPALQAHRFSNATDTLKFCSTEQNCLVIANVSTKDDLIQLATFVKTSRKSLKGTVLKIVVVNATENKQFEKAINKIGSIEILEPSVNVKALRFKMDFWMKAMRGQAKKNLGTMNQKTLDQSATQESVADTKALNNVPPIECESDIWILSRESDCKKIISRWMVKLMGPSPYVATWNDVPGKPNVWTFQIKKSFLDMFISGPGTWYFKGDQKPEFNWQENRWMFTGENLELFFHDTKVFSRLKIENRSLTLAGNSHYAKTKESLITDSFNKDLVFKNEAEHLKGNALDFENEGDLGGNLQGKVNDQETLGKANLEGKIKDQEAPEKGNLEGKIKDQDIVNNDNLEGKIKDQEAAKGNLSGKIKDKEVLDGGPLSGKTKNSEDGQNDLNGKLKKNAEEEKKDDPSGKKSPEEVRASEKNKNAQKNDEISSSWNGKVAQDKSSAKEEKDHKQHNEKLASKWGGEISKKEYEKSESPDLRGKNDSTDHLNSNWGGKKGPESIQSNGLSAPGSEGVKEGSVLDLKNSEHQHQTHYKNHNEATKYEADKTRKNQYQEEKASDLGGKTSTDILASHLGRKNTQVDSDDRDEAGKKSSPFADMPKGKADKISSNLVGSKRKPTDKQNGLDFDLDSESRSQEASGFTDEADMQDMDSALTSNVLPFFEKSKETEDLDKLTETSVVTSYISQNGKKYECTMDDYFDNNVILVCKGEGLTNSKKAFVDIKLDYSSKQARISCEGMVMSIDQDGNGGFFVTVEVPAEHAPMFDHFMKLLKSRQQNIDKFLVKVKGY